MGQKVEDCDGSFHSEGTNPPVFTQWRMVLHNGDNAYMSPTLTKAGSTYAAVKNASGNAASFSTAMTALDATWWNAIPTNHVNSDGQPLNYKEAMRLWVAAH